MAYAPKSTFSSSSTTGGDRPSAGGAAAVAGAAPLGPNGQPISPTTHVVREGEGFNNSLKIWENEGQYGAYLKMRVVENVPAGSVLKISTRKDVDSAFIQLGGAFNVKSNREFYNGIEFAVEEGKFGPIMVATTKDALAPGDYFVTQRRVK
jgi:hypothetical protein